MAKGLREFSTTERGLLIEATLALGFSYFVFGFEVMVFGALVFIAAHVYKLGLDKEPAA